ncbi:hypothetical protein [Enemella sp. A6]|uniref:hypothetical protein n=1 Tax=Enemella sp. A6 TaxID=3440152 RepID=UPI003EBC38B5
MRAGVWLDDHPLDEQWSQPVRPFRLPGWVWLVSIVLVLAAIAGTVFAAGGFEERRDLIDLRKPGAVLEVGPYEIVLDRVEVQHVQDYDDSWHWEYRVIGTITNTWHETVYFETGDHGWIAVRNPRGGEALSVTKVEVDQHGSAWVPPTGTPQSAVWTVEMDTEPTAYLAVGLVDLEYTDNTLIALGERVWNPADRAYLTYVPVIRLPDASQ